MPTIQQAKWKAAQPSKVRTPSSKASSSGSKPSAPAQSHRPITTATKSGQTRINNHKSTSGQSQGSRPLEAAAILSNPRLRQVTGLHPRKASWWNGLQPPSEELARLQWVMSLPDVYPIKRPKGNFQGNRFRSQH
ncbi:hypothetical protein F4818DRAFT_15297 [Hypoxylon cercidicola]|nr:hypothetical protein F4818DRAFT_15297 [Hypoxylon cercidicola]